MTDLQNEFEFDKEINAVSRREGKERDLAKKQRVTDRAWAQKGLRHKVVHKLSRNKKVLRGIREEEAETRRDEPKKSELSREDLRAQKIHLARRRREQLGFPTKRRNLRKSLPTSSSSPVVIKPLYQQFKRTGKLPVCTIEALKSGDRTGVTADQLRSIISAMLFKSGVEQNPGPKCPDCGKLMSAGALKVHSSKGKCSHHAESTGQSSTNNEPAKWQVKKPKALSVAAPPRRGPKGGRSGGHQRLLEQGMAALVDQLAGEKMAARELAIEAKERAAIAKKDDVTRLDGTLDVPPDVFYRVGDLTQSFVGRTVSGFTMSTILASVAMVGFMILYVVMVHTPWVAALFGIALNLTPDMSQLLICGMAVTSFTAGLVCFCMTGKTECLVVNDDGKYVDLTHNEIMMRRSITAPHHRWVGQFISFTAWLPLDWTAVFPSPDRLDSKVFCDPHLYSVLRREVYCLGGRVVDRLRTVHVSNCLAQAMIAERSGMLRNKSYEEGRRILQLYADTQNHTQIDLSWNAVGEPTSVAENTVEYVCALKMSLAGDSARLKGVEARCFL